MKNKKILLIVFLINCLLSSFAIKAEELDITASELTFLNEGKLVIAEGDVTIIDSEGNVVKTDKAEYDKSIDKVKIYQNTIINLKNGYEIISSNILYDNKNKFISSNEKSELKDSEGNFIFVNMFEYQIEKNLFSSRGEVKIIDSNKNKYYFGEVYVDTLDNKIVGSNIRVSMSSDSSSLSSENEPRFVANTAFISKDKSNFSNGVFTTCKRRGEKCPPWKLQAKKISHDKAKKTIYYEKAVLKIYDIPLFYFPKFFHPDPTVKRQSGFLIPLLTDNSTVATGLNLPYYWAISNDKDLTFTPKFYSGAHKGLFLTEYRQAFERSFLILDAGFTKGYDEPDATKTDGSRNHLYGKFETSFSNDPSYQSEFSLDFKKVSNDTYFRVHDINSTLVNSQDTTLKSIANYKYKRDDLYVNISGTVYEDLRKTTNKRYEYILPNVEFGNSLFSSQNLGTLNFKSRAYANNYDVNKTDRYFINDFIWSSKNFLTLGGFINTMEGQLKNTNYKSKGSTELRTKGTVNEIAGVFTLKSRLPLKKESENYTKTLSPNFMIRYAPGHMRNLSDNSVTLNYSNLFARNKTSQIESGLSTILGFDYSVKEKRGNDEREKFNFSIGQVFRPEYNLDIPRKSSLDQKMSDIVGELSYNLFENGKIDYKFSLDHDLNTLNYNEISSNFSFGKVDFNLDYLEETNHVGNENYIEAGIDLNITESNTLSFKTKKNYKTDSTEFYNLVYQYKNDCLIAGLEFNRNFYTDRDLEPSDTLMFKISFIPFGGVNSPSIIRD